MLHCKQKVSWTNEEALAYVMSVEMIDFPVSENQAKFEEEFGSHKGIIKSLQILKCLKHYTVYMNIQLIRR
jgi:hypothetical protein